MRSRSFGWTNLEKMLDSILCLDDSLIANMCDFGVIAEAGKTSTYGYISSR